MIASDVCREVDENQGLRAAGIFTFGIADGDAIGSHKLDARFCDLEMPERPALPLVRVAQREDTFLHGSMPVTRATTNVAMPDGARFELLGGVAAPLSWIPRPIIGCWLTVGAEKGTCETVCSSAATLRRSSQATRATATTR